nr:hypothetical protein [Pseudoduganella violaceinigra]
MEKTHRSHEDATVEMFHKNPSLAADYLNDVLATGDAVDLMMALRYLGNAFEGVQEIARKAEANPNTMYRSERGNPSLKTLRCDRPLLADLGRLIARRRDVIYSDLTSTVALTVRGTPLRSELTPMTERAWTPAGPKISARRSEAPSKTIA